MFNRLVAVLIFSAIALKAGQMAGTWKLNRLKSHYENANMPKSMTLVVHEEGGREILDFDITNADGSPAKTQVAYPIAGGKMEMKGAPDNPNLSSVIVRVPDPRHTVFTYYKKDGSVFGVRHVIVSTDGKFLIAKFTGTTRDGKTVIMNEYSEKN